MPHESKAAASVPQAMTTDTSALEALRERQIKDLRERLSDFYTPAEIDEWLESAHPLLDGQSANYLVGAGRFDEVDRALRALEDGVYL